MSKENNDSDIKNVASTSKTPDTNISSPQSRPSQQTKVFILSPDILKKLGISSEISNITSVKSTDTISKKLSPVTGKDILSSQTPVENKQAEVFKNKKGQNETSDLDTSKCDQNKTDSSVKKKLFSILTSKKDKEKLEPTSSSNENTNCENIPNQLKAENFAESTKTESELLEDTSETNDKAKSRKRKSIHENISLELSIRKSPRKRKLSNIHKDFITELKLHVDSSEQKLYKNVKINPNRINEDLEEISESNNINNEVQNTKTNDSISKNNIFENEENKIQNVNKIDEKKVVIETQNSENKVPILFTDDIKPTLSPQSPKKNIIIHENIVIQASKINTENSPSKPVSINQLQESVAKSLQKFNDKQIINKTEIDEKEPNHDFVVKIPVHEYRRKRKVIISINDEKTTENLNQTNKSVQSQEKIDESIKIQSEKESERSKQENDNLSLNSSIKENKDDDINKIKTNIMDYKKQEPIDKEKQEPIDKEKQEPIDKEKQEPIDKEKQENTQQLVSEETKISVKKKPGRPRKQLVTNNNYNNELNNSKQIIADENSLTKNNALNESGITIKKRPGRPKKVSISSAEEAPVKKEQSCTVTNEINEKIEDSKENKNNDIKNNPLDLNILLRNDKIVSANLQCDIKQFSTKSNEIIKQSPEKETISSEFDVDILNKVQEIIFDSEVSSKSENENEETTVEEELQIAVKKKSGRPKKVESLSKDEQLDTPVKSKPGRPRRSQTLTPVDTNSLSNELQPNTISSERRPGRPKKPKIDYNETESTSTIKNESSDDYSVSNSPTTSVKKKSREITPRKQTGRKSRAALFLSNDDDESASKTTKKRSRDEIEEKTKKTVTCAICNEVIMNYNWNNHTMKHNFLCWQVGKPEIDLNDRKLLESILFKKVKTYKNFKYFTCPHCGDQKKSVVGFLTHAEICQKTPEEMSALMTSCPECGKQMRTTNLKYHKHKTEKEAFSIEPEIFIENTSGRSKRKSAMKAENLIQKVSSQEKILDESTTISKSYKRYGEPSSLFESNGKILRLQSEFKKGPVKCKFKCFSEFDVFEDLKKHLYNCPALNADDYVCKICLHVEPNELKIKQHMQKRHSKAQSTSDHSDNEESDESNDDISDDGLSLNDGTNKPIKFVTEYAKPSYRVYFLACERKMRANIISCYLPALRWTLNFCKENYSQQLFQNIKCCLSDWTAVPLIEQENYLPRSKTSMSVKICSIQESIPNLQQQEHNWREYSLNEIDLEDDVVTIFCGGPIWAVAWAPTPYDSVSDQYLAISLQKDFEATYKIGSSYVGEEIIQFWNFGPLKNTLPLESKPTLVFSLAHNHGMVWCMEWCPSGCYNKTKPDGAELKKIGLLALACSDGTIPIYSIPVLHEQTESNDSKMYRTKPVFKLILQEDTEQKLGLWNYQVTKLCWSKFAPHNIIVGGYSNGMVCLWDLTNSSPLLKCERNGVTVLRPYHSFQAHASAISALDLCSLIDKGKRWLVTGSWDRSYKYWDINNTNCPVTTFGKRGVVTDGVWFNHWLCTFFAFDDAFYFGQNVTTVQNPRDFSYKQCTALAANSVVMSLSANMWANGIAQGTLAGELATSFPRSILVSYDVDRTLKCKRMLLAYNELIDKTKELSERKDIMRKEKGKNQNILFENDDQAFFKHFANSEKSPYDAEPRTYKKAREKYGLIFCDFKLDKFTSIPPESMELVKQSSRLREVPTELYPLTSLNRLHWNPNKQAFMYLASGYQNGFARIKCVRFMVPKLVTME